VLGGLNGAAVAAVMADTGLTHGGFYRHFKSKDDLLWNLSGRAFGKSRIGLSKPLTIAARGNGRRS